MRIVSWLLLFVVAFFIALILVLTFIQPEFRPKVGVQILTYKTPWQLPVYIYVVGAFVAGLGLGIMQALYTFIRTRTEIFRKNRKIRDLEQQLAERPGTGRSEQSVDDRFSPAETEE